MTHELDGSLSDFGKRLLRLLAQQAPAAHEQLLRDDLAGVSYSDRYLRSPWTLLLLAEALRTLARGAAVPLQIEAMTGNPRYRGVVGADWSVPSAQTATMQAWLAKLGFSAVDVKLVAATKDMPHHRSLVLKYRSGAEVSITFDQGMGYWMPRITPPYNAFNEDASAGTRMTQLTTAREKARVLGTGVTFTPIFVEVSAPRG